MKIKVYSIVFIQNQDEIEMLLSDLNKEDLIDISDKELFNYLSQWDQDNIECYDYNIQDASDIDSEFLGYRVDRRKSKEGYLMACNTSLNYVGLSYFKRI